MKTQQKSVDRQEAKIAWISIIILISVVIFLAIYLHQNLIIHLSDYHRRIHNTPSSEASMRECYKREECVSKSELQKILKLAFAKKSYSNKSSQRQTIQKQEHVNEELVQTDQQLYLHNQIIQLYLDSHKSDFTVDVQEYSKIKSGITTFSSPVMYTHPTGGYTLKFHLFSRSGLNVLVSFESVLDNDALQCSAEFVITLQIENKFRDQDHYTRDFRWLTNTVGQENKLISDTDLKWNTEKQTKYLDYDCLTIRVLRILLTESRKTNVMMSSDSFSIATTTKAGSDDRPDTSFTVLTTCLFMLLLSTS